MNNYQPMMARTAENPFNNPNWLFEVKWDGIRAIAYINEDVSLKTRNNKEIISKFPELRELSELTSKVVVDGEIVILTEGIPDFQAAATRNQLQKPLDIEKYVSKE